MCFNSIVISPPQLISNNVLSKGTHDYQNLPPHIESTTKKIELIITSKSINAIASATCVKLENFYV